MQISLSIVGAFSVLLFIISLHLFFAKRGNVLLNRLFSIVIFARVGQLFIYLLVSSGYFNLLPFLLSLFTPLYFAAPACLYLYVDRFLNEGRVFRNSDLLHFIPCALAVVHVIPWGISASPHWDIIAGQILDHKQLFLTESTGVFPAYFYYAGRALLWLGYLGASWAALFASAREKAAKWTIPNTWIFFCLCNSTFFNLTGIAPLLFQVLPHSASLNEWFVAINALAVISVMSYIFHRPQFLYGYLIIGARWKDGESEGMSIPAEIVPVQQVPADTEPLVISPRNNLLSGQMYIYTEAMKTYMDTDKPFLLPGFQIMHLAQRLDIPVHQCSFIINNVIGKNFRDWINAYRVKEFIEHYPVLCDKMTIEAIASQSGFKSVATFYNAFKKETGSMPKAYFVTGDKEYSV